MAMRFFLRGGGSIAVLLLVIVLLPLGAGCTGSAVILSWFAAHMHTVVLVYGGLAFCMGLGCYRSCGIASRLAGAAASALVFLPMEAEAVLRLLPYALRRSFASTELLIAVLLLFLVTCFIQMLGLSFANCCWHLAVAVIFCVVAGVLMRCLLTTADAATLCGIYGLG